MELTPFLIIAGALLLLSVLLLVSGIALYSNQRKKDPERIAEKKKSLLSGKASDAETNDPRSSIGDSGAQESGEIELLRVMRDPIDGRLSVRLLGSTAGSPGDLDQGQHEQLAQVIDEIGAWTKQAEPRPPAEEPFMGAETQVVEASEGSVPFASTLPDRVELKDVIPFRRKNVPKLNEAPPPPRSIAVQIDEIVQNKLERSSLAGMAVHLSEEPGGGLKIVVGNSEYQTIEDVENAEVKALIKRSVREWNEKNRLNPNPPGHK